MTANQRGRRLLYQLLPLKEQWRYRWLWHIRLTTSWGDYLLLRSGVVYFRYHQKSWHRWYYACIYTPGHLCHADQIIAKYLAIQHQEDNFHETANLIAATLLLFMMVLAGLVGCSFGILIVHSLLSVAAVVLGLL